MNADPLPRRLLILACSATKRNDRNQSPPVTDTTGRSGGLYAPLIRTTGLLASASSPRGTASAERKHGSKIMTRNSPATWPSE
jgi:hypothetical protein